MHGQLGRGFVGPVLNELGFMPPAYIQAPEGVRFEEVGCGNVFSQARAQGGGIWDWGANFNG